jgi:hypothetical protein
VLDSLAGRERQSFEHLGAGAGEWPFGIGGEEDLAEARCNPPCDPAGLLEVDRYVAPPEHDEAFTGGDPRYIRFGGQASVVVYGEEPDPGGVGSRVRQVEAALVGRDVTQQAVRHLHEDSRSVAGLRIRAERPTVSEVFECREPTVDKVVAGGADELGDERDTTRVVFEVRLVEAGRV